MESEEGRRTHHPKDLGGEITMNGRLVAHKVSQDGTEAVRIADDRSRSSTMDLREDGTLSYTVEGPSPHGETSTLEVCSILVQRLNKEGANWEEPSQPVGHKDEIDCIASDGSQELLIQVTRAVDSRLWKPLAISGRAGESDKTVESATDDLRRAVKHKEVIPRAQRRDILLAINAVDTPGHAVKAVVELFRLRYGQETRMLGFKGVWVVGPTATLTMRLDS